MGYQSAIRRNEVLIQTATLLNLKMDLDTDQQLLTQHTHTYTKQLSYAP